MDTNKVRLSLFTDTITITFDTDDMKEGKGGWDIRSRCNNQLSTGNIIELTEIIEAAYAIITKLTDTPEPQ